MIRVCAVIATLILALFFISFWLNNSTIYSENNTAFECGFDPNHESRNSFSIRFFLLTIVFLLFDLEITFILSLPININSISSSAINSTHLIIFLLFVWSTYLEWNIGAFDWFWFDI